MTVRVEVLLGDRDGRGVLEGTLDRQAPRHGGKVAARLVGEIDHLRFGDSHHATLLQVKEDPPRVGRHEALPVLSVHREAAQGLESVDAIGPGLRAYGVTEVGETIDLDLPFREDPAHVVVVEVVEADTKRLGMEGGAVL